MAVLLGASSASAQVATGTPPFGSFGGGPFDTINLANLNVHFSIPIMNKAGRVLPFTYALNYDNSIWYPVGASGSQVWTAVAGWGWNSISDGSTGYVDEYINATQCMDQNGHSHPLTYYTFGPYEDPAGTSHPIYVQTTPGQSLCYPVVQPVTGGTTFANDGSGYTLVVTNYTSAVIKSVGGVTINPYIWQGGGFTTPQGSVVDPDGNTISSSYNAATTTTTFTDTLNVPNEPVLTVYAPGPGSTPTTLSYWNPQGNNNTPYTIKYTPQIVETNFGCSAVTDYGRTTQMNQYLVSEIDLPDGTEYTLGYEATPNPNHQGAVTGRLAKVTLPTGGEIDYEYTGGNNHGITCADGTTVTLQRETPDTGYGWSKYWQYAHTETGTLWGTTVTDPTTPAGNVSGYSFQQVSGTQLAYETERKINQGSSPLLVTVDTCYNGAAIPCTTTAITYPLSSRVVQTTFPNTSASKTSTSYNSYTMPTEIDAYDYGSTTMLDKTTITYNTSLYGIYMYDRPATVYVYDNAGSLKASTAYAYNSTGHATTATYGTQGSSTIQQTFNYNSNGTLNYSQDFKSNQTSFGYGGTGSCGSSFPTTITLPITSFSVSMAWDCNGGVPTSVTDINGQPTTLTYDDPNHFWRLTGVGYADGGSTTTTYTDSANAFAVETSTALSSSASHQVTQLLDSLGRLKQTQDNSASSYVDTAYNILGQVLSVSNPYFSTSDTTYGSTLYGYDALGRATSVQAPDGSTTSASFVGNTSNYCSTVTDPAGNVRKLCSDGLGRVTAVTEDPGTSPHLNYQTAYTYDPLNDLTGVTQGSQTRTYSYDLLSRLTSAATPEAGTVTYSYATSGNPCSGDPSAPCSRTDARNITTTYAYDTLNRLTSKTYSDGTPTANFSYDQSSVTIGSWTSQPLTNPKGRMTEATTTASGSVNTAVVYSYDSVGRILDLYQCNPSNCGASPYTTKYTYDIAGDVTSWAHPAGYTLTNSVNPAQQVWQVQSSWQDSSHPQYLAQNITYTPWGAVSQLENGCVGSGCANAQETYTYNKQLQPSMIQLTGTSNGGYCLVYNYYADESNPTSCTAPAQGTKNNGNVMGYWYQDSVQSGYSHTATYTYDSVNRLLTAVGTPFGSGTVSYNLNFNNYDRYGNMTCETNAQTNGPCPNWAFNTTTNQLASSTGCTYDAAGDLTKDCSTAAGHTYQWDAEGRVASVDSGSTWGFTYNALGQRVQWTYSNGAGANQLLFDPAGGWLGVAGIYSLLRRGDGYLVVYFSSETYLNHMNNIGSTTAVTNHAGTPVGEVLFYPWGQVWQGWGSGGSNFAELPYDDGNTNTNLTMFRLQSPGLGRWLSPDPLGGDPTNPQSLDRYAYVLNSPTSMVDPLGLFAPNPCGFDPSLCAAPGGGGGGGGRPRPCAQIVMAGGSVQPDALGCGALLLVAVPAAGHRRPVLKEMLGDPGSAPGISSTPHPNLAPRSRRL